MIIGINQPYYLPYIWVFERMKACDYFVINPYTPVNRNRTKVFHRSVKIIQTNPEAKLDSLYITQYVSKNDDLVFYSDIKLKTEFWERQKNHIKTIYFTYKKSKYFCYLEELLNLMNDTNISNLGEYNIRLIKHLALILGLEEKIIDASKDKRLAKIDYRKCPGGFKNKSTYLAYSICHSLKGTKHITGPMGPKWLDINFFKQNNIKISYQNNNLQPYKQYCPKKKFVPALSVIDLIANLGPNARDFIGQNSSYIDDST